LREETRIVIATRAPPSKRRDQNQEDAATMPEHATHDAKAHGAVKVD
jgi:hypothetical protein